MAHLKTQWVLSVLLASLTFSRANPCQDSTYLKLKASPLSGLKKAEIVRYLQLDSLCQAESTQEIVLSHDSSNSTIKSIDSSHSELSSSEFLEYQRKSELRKQKQSGTVLSGLGMGLGASIFIMATLVRSQISDECNPLFTLNLFKSPEECKEEADQKRETASKFMAVGGVFTLAGLVGLIAVNSLDLKPSYAESAKPDKSYSPDSNCDEIENKAERFKCFRSHRLYFNSNGDKHWNSHE